MLEDENIDDLEYLTDEKIPTQFLLGKNISDFGEILDGAAYKTSRFEMNYLIIAIQRWDFACWTLILENIKISGPTYGPRDRCFDGTFELNS